MVDEQVLSLQGGSAGLYDNDAHVLAMTSHTFPKRKDQSVYLVEFYAPWYTYSHNALCNDPTLQYTLPFLCYYM